MKHQDNFSLKKKRRSINSGIAATILLFSSACVVTSGDTPEDPSSSNQPAEENNPKSENGATGPEVLASSITTATEIGSDLQIDVHGLERLENNLLRLRLGITNNSPETFDIGFGLSTTEDRLSASNVSLLDTINQKRYLSYNQSDGSCLCDSLEGPIGSGSTETLWVIFPEPPPDVESMTVATPLTPPLLDIPISTSSDSVENGNLAEPEILDLTMISDGLEDQTGRTENSDEVSILLSSDVLFSTNSSNLTDEAQGILEQVAQEIDDASSENVDIDGYADNTGSDSINMPLSKERAESVESALNALITRTGVTFTVEGHGSADPIADNSTEEGRDRNRRVSVTFEK